MVVVELWLQLNSHSSFETEDSFSFFLSRSLNITYLYGFYLQRNYNTWLLVHSVFMICVSMVPVRDLNVTDVCVCWSLRWLLAMCRVGWVGLRKVLLVRYSTDTMNVSHLREKSDTSQNLSLPISPVICTTERRTFYTEKCHKRTCNTLGLR